MTEHDFTTMYITLSMAYVGQVKWDDMQILGLFVSIILYIYGVCHPLVVDVSCV